jgi:hypothetical protein
MGQTFRSRKLGEVVEVVYIDGPQRITDGRSFGYNFDDGYAWTTYVVPAEKEDKEKIEDNEKRKELERNAKKHKKELSTKIQQDGELPKGVTDVQGDTLAKSDSSKIIRGYGSWFLIEPNKWIWYIKNNGANGDDWGRNNVQTGGAGAIGWRVPHDDSLEEEIRDLDAALSGSGSGKTSMKKMARRVANRYFHGD